MTKNWKNIHPDFGNSRLWGEYFRWQWENNGFDYDQTKAWIFADLRPWEYNIAWYLAKKQNLNPQNLNRNNIESAKKDAEDNLKKEWEDFSINEKVNEPVEWLKRGFSYEEAKQQIEKGLKTNEYDLADYLKNNPNSSLASNNIEKARKEYHNAQNWLDFNYPQTRRNEIKELVINNHNLVGVLKVENFPNLEGLYCLINNLVSLECANCPQLKVVLGQQNKLTNLILNKCPSLTKLVFNKNNLTNLNFLQNLSTEKLAMLNISSNKIAESDLNPFRNFVNLKHLGLGNWYKEIIEQEGIYNHFTGSLEPLKNLTKLEELDLAGTDVDSGWEYLPESIHIFYLFAKERPESKSSIIIGEELKKYGEAIKDRHEDDDFALLLRKWKEYVKSELIANVPTDKFYLIRTNLEKFFYKWGGEEIKNLKEWTTRNEVYKYLNISLQWTNRLVSVAGGSMLLVGNAQDNTQFNLTGGIIAVVAPFIETSTSYFENKFSEEKKRKWEEFIQDAENLFANCRELESSIPLNSPSYPDKLNKVLKNLNAKTYELLKKYDEDKNLEIDNEEWEAARKQFPIDLKNSWESETKKSLKEIVKAMINLEKKAREIHQGIFYKLTELEEAKKDTQKQIEKLLQKNSVEVRDLDPNLWEGNANWEKHLLKLNEVKQITDFVEKMKQEIINHQGLKSQVEVVAK